MSRQDEDDEDEGEEMYVDNWARVFEFIPHGARCEALIGQLQSALTREGTVAACAANGLKLLDRAAMH